MLNSIISMQSQSQSVSNPVSESATTAPLNIPINPITATTTTPSPSIASTVSVLSSSPSIHSPTIDSYINSGSINSNSSSLSVSQLSSALAADESGTTVLSSQLLSLFNQTLNKLVSLRLSERSLSVQAGSLLKSLQSEESAVNTLTSTLKRVRHEHKKLLSRIVNPRWEIKHHYHMTCIEHNLGHRQPHVMDVAEMLPGHLKYYAIARTHALLKRALTYSSHRGRTERNSAAEQIKEAYRQLREVRIDIKELQRMLETMQAKFHLLPNNEDRQKLESIIRNHKKQLSNLSATAAAAAGRSGGSSSNNPVLGLGSNSSSNRMKYLKSLNLAPKLYESHQSIEVTQQQQREQKQRTEQTYNNDWKQISSLLTSLEQTQSAAGAGAGAAAGQSVNNNNREDNNINNNQSSSHNNSTDNNNSTSINNNNNTDPTSTDSSSTAVIASISNSSAQLQKMMHKRLKRIGLDSLPQIHLGSDSNSSTAAIDNNNNSPSLNSLPSDTSDIDTDAEDEVDSVTLKLAELGKDLQVEPLSPLSPSMAGSNSPRGSGSGAGSGSGSPSNSPRSGPSSSSRGGKNPFFSRFK